MSDDIFVLVVVCLFMLRFTLLLVNCWCSFVSSSSHSVLLVRSLVHVHVPVCFFLTIRANTLVQTLFVMIARNNTTQIIHVGTFGQIFG